MKFRFCSVVALGIAFSSSTLMLGCTNATNESGAGNTTPGVAPPNAPKTQAEFLQQQQEEAAKAKASKKAGRTAK